MTEIILRSEIQRNTALRLLSGLDLSKAWQITVTRFRKKRTISQNALYWKWVGVIADETGNDPDEIHELFKRKFLTPVETEVAGEVYLYRSTAKLNTQDMTTFMDRVSAWAAGNGFNLPFPEDMHMRGAA